MEVMASNLLGAVKAIVGDDNIKNIINGGNDIMKKKTGMNMQEAMNSMEDKINKFGLGEEAVKKEEPKEEDKKQTVEEAKIMEDVKAAVDGEETANASDDILSPMIKDIMLLNRDVTHQAEIEISENTLVNKIIIGMIERLKGSFKLSGLIDGEKEEAIKAFLLSLSSRKNEIKVLPAGGIEFWIGQDKTFEACCPGIIPPDTTFGMISTKNLQFKVTDEVVEKILYSFKRK